MTTSRISADQLVRKHTRALREAGRLHLQQGSLEAAAECLGHALDTYRELEEPAEIATTAELLADLSSIRDEPQGALRLLREAQRAREQLDDHDRLAGTLVRMAQVHMRQRRPELALEYLEQAGERVPPEDHTTRALILTRLATIERNQGQNRAALDHCEEARDLLGADGDRAVLGECLNAMGSVLGQLGRLEAAVSVLEESLEARRALGERKGEAQALNSLGIVLMQVGENERARASFDRALKLCDDLGDARWRSVTLNNLGVVSKRLDDMAAAEGYYRQCSEVAKQLDDPYARALAARNLAFVAYLRGSFQPAETLALDSLRLCRSLDERQGEVESLERLCLIALATNRGETARERVAELVTAAQGLGLPEVERRQPHYRARTALMAGDLEAARRASDEALELAGEEIEARAWAVACGGIAESQAGRVTAGLETIRKAQVMLRAASLPHPAAVITLEALRHARLAEAELARLADEASDAFRELESPGWCVEVQLAVAEVLLATNVAAAAARLRAAVELAEEFELEERADLARLRLRELSRGRPAPDLDTSLAAEITLPRANLRVLYELGRTVGTLLDPRALADKLAALARERFAADLCVVYLEDEDRPFVLRGASAGDDVGMGGGSGAGGDASAGTDASADAGAVDALIPPRSVLRRMAGDGAPQLRRGERDLPPAIALLCQAPLRVDPRRPGVLAAVFVDPRAWSSDEELLLSAMANVAAPALHNARLVEELEHARDVLSAENLALREVAAERAEFDAFIGRAESMQRFYDLLDKASRSGMNVLLRGEGGTGKELAARSIHFRSPRRAGPFVKLNCAAIPETLVESELFGVEKGTATGVQPRIGRFEQASGGTLLLDEVGDMPLAVQAKVLRALQESEIERVGGRRPIRIDTRIIAATNRDVERAVEEGTFRRDLYYRLRVIDVQIPPLRERTGDVPLLAMHFLRSICAAEEREIEGFDTEAWALLTGHDWPGNVRELEHVVAHAVVVCDAPRIRAADLPRLGSEAPSAGESLKEMMRRAERQILERVLAEERNRGQAARRLGIGRSTFYAKLKEHGLLDSEPA